MPLESRVKAKLDEHLYAIWPEHMPRVVDRKSPVLEKLAELYICSEAGKTGAAKNGFCIRYDELLKAACCLSGDRFANAVADLESSDGQILTLKRRRNLKS